MPRVPMLNPQRRRTGQGLGLAVDPKEARQWGQGFAQLGESMFRTGSALHKLQQSNRELVNRRAVSDAKNQQELEFQQIASEQKDLPSALDYTDTVMSLAGKSRERINKEIKKKYGNNLNQATLDEIYVSTQDYLTKSMSQIFADGEILKTQYLEQQSNEMITQELRFGDGVFNAENPIDEAIEKITNVDRIVNENLEAADVLPGSPRAERKLKEARRQAFLRASENFLNEGMFREARTMVELGEQGMFLDADTSKKIKEDITQKQIQYVNFQRSGYWDNIRVEEHLIQEQQRDNFYSTLEQFVEAKAEGNTEAITDLQTKLTELAATQQIGEAHLNLGDKMTQRELQRSSKGNVYSVLERAYKTLDRGQIPKLRDEVESNVLANSMTHEDGTTVNRILRELETRLQSDPSLKHEMKAAIHMLKAHLPNETTLETIMANTKIKDPFSPEAMALSQRMEYPFVQLYTLMATEGISPMLAAHQVLSDFAYQEESGSIFPGDTTFTILNDEAQVKEFIIQQNARLSAMKELGMDIEEQERKVRSHVLKSQTRIKLRNTRKEQEARIREELGEEVFRKKKEQAREAINNSIIRGSGVEDFLPDDNSVQIPFRR